MYKSDYKFNYIVSKTVHNFTKHVEYSTDTVDELSTMIYNNDRFDYHSVINDCMVHMYFQFIIQDNVAHEGNGIMLIDDFRTDFAKYINYLQPDYIYRNSKKREYPVSDSVIKNPPINEPYLEYLLLKSRDKNKTIYRIHFYNIIVTELQDLKTFSEYFTKVYPKYKEYLDTSVYKNHTILSIPKDNIKLSHEQNDDNNQLHIIEYVYSVYGDIKKENTNTGLTKLFDEIVCASIPCFISHISAFISFDYDKFKNGLQLTVTTN